MSKKLTLREAVVARAAITEEIKRVEAHVMNWQTRRKRLEELRLQRANLLMEAE
jgi:hypothetical protein